MCIKEYGGIDPNHETDDPLPESPLAAGSYYEHTATDARTKTSHTFDRNDVQYRRCRGQLTL